MSYELVFKDEVKQDLIELSHSQRLLVFKQFSKLENSPKRGCRKIYVDKKKIRIVYRIIDDEIVVEVIVVGKRSDMKVYADASERLS